MTSKKEKISKEEKKARERLAQSPLQVSHKEMMEAYEEAHVGKDEGKRYFFKEED